MNERPFSLPSDLRDQPRKRVLIFSPATGASNRGHIAGILRYSMTIAYWDVLVLADVPSARTVKQMTSFAPHGVIMSERFYAELAKRKSLPTCPTVLFTENVHQSYGDIPCIRTDDEAIGRAAASHFIAKGCSAFAAVGLHPGLSASADERVRAYSNALTQAGKSAPFFYGENVPSSGETWTINRSALAAFLSKLPKPCAIFTISDAFAWQVLQVCTNLGLVVPGQVRILGCDDDEMFCRASEPRLSSVAPDYNAGGYLAGKVLSRLIWGRKSSVLGRCFPYGIKGIAERESTLDPTGLNYTIVRAKEFIAEHYAEDLSVADVAAALKISKRLLNLHFSKTSAKSVHEEILKTRLRNLAALLIRRDTPIREATIQCGFKSENHAKFVFKKRFGMTMRDYRDKPRRRSEVILP